MEGFILLFVSILIFKMHMCIEGIPLQDETENLVMHIDANSNQIALISLPVITEETDNGVNSVRQFTAYEVPTSADLLIQQVRSSLYDTCESHSHWQIYKYICRMIFQRIESAVKIVFFDKQVVKVPHEYPTSQDILDSSNDDSFKGTRNMRLTTNRELNDEKDYEMTMSEIIFYARPNRLRKWHAVRKRAIRPPDHLDKSLIVDSSSEESDISSDSDTSSSERATSINHDILLEPLQKPRNKDRHSDKSVAQDKLSERLGKSSVVHDKSSARSDKSLVQDRSSERTDMAVAQDKLSKRLDKSLVHDISSSQADKSLVQDKSSKRLEKSFAQDKSYERSIEHKIGMQSLCARHKNCPHDVSSDSSESSESSSSSESDEDSSSEYIEDNQFYSRHYMDPYPYIRGIVLSVIIGCFIGVTSTIVMCIVGIRKAYKSDIIYMPSPTDDEITYV